MTFNQPPTSTGFPVLPSGYAWKCRGSQAFPDRVVLAIVGPTNVEEMSAFVIATNPDAEAQLIKEARQLARSLADQLRALDAVNSLIDRANMLRDAR